MTHMARKEGPLTTGATFTINGLKVPLIIRTTERYIKWDLKEDFQRLINLTNLLLSTLRIKKS